MVTGQAATIWTLWLPLASLTEGQPETWCLLMDAHLGSIVTKRNLTRIWWGFHIKLQFIGNTCTRGTAERTLGTRTANSKKWETLKNKWPGFFLKSTARRNKKITGRGTYGLRVWRDTSTKCNRRSLITKATGSSKYLSDTTASQTGWVTDSDLLLKNLKCSNTFLKVLIGQRYSPRTVMASNSPRWGGKEI